MLPFSILSCQAPCLFLVFLRFSVFFMLLVAKIIDLGGPGPDFSRFLGFRIYFFKVLAPYDNVLGDSFNHFFL